jgi:serine/threonine protein kinase
MPIEPGTLLGSYEIISRVGSGGMGDVYKARDSRLDRFVAIKVLSEFWMKDSTFLARFEREVRVLASLSHPNIVGIFDFGEVDGRTYAVMELLEGRTLRQALSSGPMLLRQVADIGSQIALGLSVAHNAGVIHRDLKPENIFLTDGGLVKLLDFGLAKKVLPPKPEEESPEIHPTSTNAGVLMGTVGYMAPEQLEPDGKVDARSDLFALGCVLYEMITGTRAFTSETSMGTLHAILTQDPDLERAEIPTGLRELLRYCLAKQSEFRFQNAQDLAYTLQALGRPAGPIPQEPPQPSWRPRWVLLPAAFFVGIAGMAMGLHAWLISSKLPVFTPLSPRGGQVYAARFTANGHAVYALRQGDGPAQVLETEAGDDESPLPLLQGFVPLSRLRDGTWLLLRGGRHLVGGQERLEGDLLRLDSQGGPLQAVADGVCGADATSDGAIIATIRRVDGRERLEAPLGTIRAETAGWLDAPRISPSGTWIAYLDHPSIGSEGVLTVVNLQDGQRRALTDTWNDLRGLAWSPTGEVWFTGAKTTGPRTLYAASLRGRIRPVLAAPENLTLEDIAPNGEALISQEHQEEAVIARPPTGDPGPAEWEDPSLLGLSADGRWAALTSVRALPPGKVFLLRLGQEAEPVGTASLAAPSQDGSTVVLASPQGAGWRLTLWSRLGSKEIPLQNFNTLRQIEWGPGDAKLLLAGTVGAGGFRVWRMNTDGTDLQPLGPEGVSPDRPFLLSPDGRWLLVQAGPLLTRMDLQKPQSLPQTLPFISPGEHILGWGRDDDHVLVVGPRLPAMTATLSLLDGSRESAFPLAAYGHAGALIDQAVSTLGGESYAIGCRETRSRLFLVSGFH